jgi:hypothetical protein
MVIETWRNSGMSVSKLCKAEGLSEGAFYNWHKRLSVAVSRPNEPSEPRPSAFIKVALSKNNHALLELELSSGIGLGREHYVSFPKTVNKPGFSRNVTLSRWNRREVLDTFRAQSCIW